MSSPVHKSSHAPTLSPSSASPTSQMGSFPAAIGLPANYHYEKTSAVNTAPTANAQILESKRHFTQKETRQAITTIGKTHKSNFSVTSLLGAHQGGSGSGFGSKTRHPDPWSFSSVDGLRAQFGGGSQGPHSIPLAGRVDDSVIQRKLEALEPSGHTGELRNSPSSISLKLKIPKFKSLGRPRTSHDNRTQSHSSAPSSRPMSPFSLRSPVLGFRPRISDDTFSLGTMSFENKDNGSSYLIGNQRPNSEESQKASTPNSPPFSTTSTASTHEEPVPLTPSEIRSGLFRLESPALSGLSPSQRDDDDLKYTAFLCDDVSSVIRSAEFLRTRTRPFPTVTQDDMSLDVPTMAEKRKSLNRFSRRASVSTTSMLSSSSSAFSKHSGSSSPRLDISDKDHRSTLPNTPTVKDPGNPEDDSTTPLSPITFGRAPSPRLDPTRTSSPEHPLPPTPTASSRQSEDDSAPTPTALVHPDMPFNTIVDTSSHRSRQTTSSHSNPQSRSTSRTRSAEGSRVSTPDASSRRTGSSRNNTKVTPAQLAKWEEDRKTVTRDIMELHAGEACVIRYEAKQGWMGVWSRPNIKDVIEGLRDLRSPKF